MERNINTCHLCIRLGKGKEHLISVMKILELTMTPNQICRVEICADPTNPEKISCSVDKDFKKDELKEFVDTLLNDFTGWEDFD
jgi:hypothetical protein